MGERRVKRDRGAVTVIRDGQIINNLPGAGALHPVSGSGLGSQAVPSENVATPGVDALYSVFAGKGSAAALEAAQDDFQSWVLHAAFAPEGDSTRGRFWEGATRYATTAEGRAALERIAANGETTPALRSAAGAMLAEVELYGEDIEQGWLVPAEVLAEQPPLGEPLIEPSAHVSSDSKDNLSPDTQVLGTSNVTFGSRTEGPVTLRNAKLYDAKVTDSVIEESSVEHATVTNSTVDQATVAFQRYASTNEQALFPTSVSGSTIGPGGYVVGATVTDSTVLGEVVGTSAAEAGLVNRNHIGEYYESYVNGFGDTSSERARPRIGEIAEEATHARVVRSTVGQHSAVRNAHLTDVVLKDGVDVDTAVVENTTVEGTAHIAGSFTHERKVLKGYRWLQEIIPRDRRARVSNVTLTREFVGEAAEVTKQSHVKSLAADGMVITRYRTRFRTKLRRAVWAYTTTTVDPRTGSLKREFVGYDHGDESTPEVLKMMRFL